MRSSHVRAFALLGALCCALTAVFAQQPNSTSVPFPSQGGGQPAQNTPSDATNSSSSATATLPSQARRPSLMVRQGDFELEWRNTYSHSSRNAIFIDGVAVVPVVVVGQIGVERVRRDSVNTSISGRYGLADNVLGELKVPFRYQSDRISIPDVNPPQENVASGFGLGDIEASVAYQLPRKSEKYVRWVVNAGVKSATGKDSFEINQREDVPLGTGFWSLKAGITGVKIADPAAVYWSLGYTYNFKRERVPIIVVDPQTGDEETLFVDIKPGNSVELGGGFAYAVNSQLSLNTGLSISFSQSTDTNGDTVANTAITSASLRMGVVWLTENRRPIDLGLSIGLTDDSPDFSLEFRQNYQF